LLISPPSFKEGAGVVNIFPRGGFENRNAVVICGKEKPPVVPLKTRGTIFHGGVLLNFPSLF